MKIPFPINGRSDNYSFEDQPPTTSVDALNVRAADPITGRIRGAQRGGLERVSDERLGAGGKVQALASVTFDSRQTTFSNKATSAPGDLTEWSDTVSNADESLVTVVDFQGNVYALNGPVTLTKFNAKGVKQWDFALPVSHQSHIVRALEVDEFGQVFVGVSAGREEALAWVRSYVLDDETNLALLWEFLPGGFCERIQLKDDKAFLAINIPSTGRSRVVALEGIGSVAPTKAQEWPIPHPVNDLAVKTNGDLFSAHEPKTDRSHDPRLPNQTVILDAQRWDPTQLEDWDKRKYTWLSGSTIKEQFGLENIQDGEEILEWRDMLARKRCVMRPDTFTVNFQKQNGTVVPLKTPRYVSSGLGGRPGVGFLGDGYRMISDMSLGKGPENNDLQPLVQPSGIGFLTVIVARLDPTYPTSGGLFYQSGRSVVASSERFHEQIAVNANLVVGAQDNLTVFSAGDLAFRVAMDSASVVAASETWPTNVNGTRYDNKNNAVIISVLNSNTESILPSSKSYIRVNGTPVAKYAPEFLQQTHFFATFNANNTKQGRSVLGAVAIGLDDPTPPGAYRFDGLLGEIYEIFVLRTYTDSNGDRRLCSVPDYNANASGGAGSEPAFDPVSDTELERIEGFFAWKYGIADLLDDGTVTAAASPTWDSAGGHSQYTQPFCLDAGTSAPPNPNGRGADTTDNTLWVQETPIVAAWSGQHGTARWAFSGSGVGYGVIADDDGNPVNVGPKAGGNGHTVQQLVDENTTYTTGWTYTAGTTSGGFAEYGFQHPRLALDAYGQVWVPGNWTDELAPKGVVAFDDAGTRVMAYQLGGGQAAHAVSVDPREVSYLPGDLVTLPEFIALATDSGTTVGQDTIHSVGFVLATPNNASPRNFVWLGVCGGNVVKFTGGPVLAVSGGSGALSASATLVSAVTAFDRVYFADGVGYRKYNPKTDAIERWIATSEGGIPERCRLLSFWRGRMVLARGSNDPFNWHMSASGDPDDWNQFPAVNVATQAISGNNAEIGSAPDIVNALIAYDRERLIFGGDHSINIMWGDPMEGGSISLLSDTTGIAFGSAYCKDAGGVLYFFGSRGGVYALIPGQQVEKISSETIDRLLMDVDLGTYTIGMTWDDVEQQLVIFQIPYGAGGELVNHFVWEKKSNAWWLDRFAATDVQPTALLVLDGDDPDDRIVAVGCEDGHVRRLSRTSTTDDGYAIDSYVTIGPYFSPDGELRLRNPKVTLARDQGGCWLEMFAGDTPDVLGEPVASALLAPGQNPKQMLGARGAYVWLRLRNAGAGQRWAFESGMVDVYPAGRKVAR